MPALDAKEAESLFAEARDQPEKAQLPSTTNTEVAPSLVASQTTAAVPTQESQSQLLNLWFSSRTEEVKEQKDTAADDEDDRSAVEGMAMDFVPDTQISAADYLAPDDSGSTLGSGGGCIGSSGAGGTTQS